MSVNLIVKGLLTLRTCMAEAGLRDPAAITVSEEDMDRLRMMAAQDAVFYFPLQPSSLRGPAEIAGFVFNTTGDVAKLKAQARVARLEALEEVRDRVNARLVKVPTARAGYVRGLRVALVEIENCIREEKSTG
jgi:hypothetical protein